MKVLTQKFLFLLIALTVFKVKAQVPNISYITNNLTLNVGTTITPLTASNSGGAIPAAFYGETSNLSNSTNLNTPFGMAKDGSGNLFVADSYNNKIIKIDVNGNVSVFAGSGAVGSLDSVGIFASFNFPLGLAIDNNSNLYVADGNNHKIRKITPLGQVSTYAGTGTSGSNEGAFSVATFNTPTDLAIANDGSIYVSDRGNNKIRKIIGGLVSTYAGSGSSGDIDAPTITATFNSPRGLAIDGSGNIFVADFGNNKIRKINTAGLVTTYAGNGTAGNINSTPGSSSFNGPIDVAVDTTNNVFVSDRNNHCIRLIEYNGNVKTLAGTGIVGSTNGVGTNARFNAPNGLLIYNNGTLLVSELNNVLIRKISLFGFAVSPNLPVGLSINNNGQISGTPTLSSPLTNYKINAFNSWGKSSFDLNIKVNSGNTNLKSITFSNPAISLEPYFNSNNLNYEAASLDTNLSFKVLVEDTNATVTYNINNGSYVTLMAGVFTTTLRLSLGDNIINVKVKSSDTLQTKTYSFKVTNMLTPFVTYPSFPLQSQADFYFTVVGRSMTSVFPSPNNRIAEPVYKLNKVFSGSGAQGTLDSNSKYSSFNKPTGVAVDKNGIIYIADQFNHKIRKIALDGKVTTLAGSGTIGSNDGAGNIASFNNPTAITVDSIGNVYVTDIYNHKIRKITPAGLVSTLAGSGSSGFTNGIGASASFSYPNGIACDKQGNIYVADQGNHAIRKILPNGTVGTIAGNGAAGYYDTVGVYASFNTPSDLAVDSVGNIFVADKGNNRIRKILVNGLVTTFVGNGLNTNILNNFGTMVSLNSPEKLSLDKKGNLFVFVTNGLVNISPNGFTKSHLAGVTNVGGLAINNSGDIYYTSINAHLINKVSNVAYTISPDLPYGLSINGLTGEIGGKTDSLFPKTTYTITCYNRVGSYSYPYFYLKSFLQSNNADLKVLRIQITTSNIFQTTLDATLSPTFNKDSLNYNTTVTLSYKKSIVVSLNTVDTGALVYIKQNNGNFFLSKKRNALGAGDFLDLVDGMNTFLIRSISSDSIKIKTYTINVFRTSSNPIIDTLTLNSFDAMQVKIPLSPVFRSDTFNYNATVFNYIGRVEVNPYVVASGQTLKVKINDSPYVVLPSLSPNRVVSLDTGMNIIKVLVQNADSSIVKVYTINIRRKSIVGPGMLTYSDTVINARVGQPIDSIRPANNGDPIDSYFISPALPNGLFLHPTKGIIYGIPTVATASTIYTISGFCFSNSSISKVRIIVSPSISVKNAQNSQFESLAIYPNPFTDNLSLSFNAIENSAAQFEIVDAVGRKVYGKKLTFKVGLNNFDINDLPNLKLGLYFVNITDENANIKTIKLIKAN